MLVGMVVIRSPKTVRVAGRVQRVTVHDCMVIILAQCAWLAWPRQAKLVPFNLVEFSRWFRAALTHWGLPQSRFTPAGLRTGGATYAYLCGGSVEQLMWRGRWEMLTSLKHHVQESASTLATAQLPPEAAERLVALASGLCAVLYALTLTWSESGRLDK